MTTYTVISQHGDVIATGLSLRDAADEVLSSDSREYDVRQDSDGTYTLWSRQQVANRGWTATRFFSVATDRGEAEDEIFRAVVIFGYLSGHHEVIPDAAYAATLAQLSEGSE